MPPIAEQVLQSPGQPLDAETRAFVEPRFGHDFSQVRVHTDARAENAATALSARAFTSNHDIVFGAGEYAPQSEAGQRLLFHELTHVVQQQAGVHLDNGLGKVGDRYEREADAVANQLANGQSAGDIRGSGNVGPGSVQRNAMGSSIQLQPLSSRQTGSKKDNKRKPTKQEPDAVPPVTISAGLQSATEIIATLRTLEAMLRDPLISDSRSKSITRSVQMYAKALLNAPVEPTPKRDYIRGPIHFQDGANPHFYSFTFQSLADKAWTESWAAFYKFALMEVGIVFSVCEAILKEEDTDRSFDEAGKEKEFKGNWKKFSEDQGQQSPSYFLSYGVAKPMDWFGKTTGTHAATVVGRAASRLAFVIDAALTGYEIYQANTAGPSLHAAAVEITARVMGKAFNMASGINMIRGHGGEFIPHQDATTEVRVARNPLDRTPLPQLTDRRMAYDMVGNRVYEMMMNVLAPKHLASPAAFNEFRDARIANAGNIVDNAGASIIEQSEKFGGKMILVREDEKSPVIEIGKVDKVDKAKALQVLPCQFPHPLGKGRDHNPKAKDFESFDYPPNVPSKVSELKLAAWAALHSLSFPPDRSTVSDAVCEKEMDKVLTLSSGAPGHDAVVRFISAKGGVETMDNSSELGKLALKAPSFLATVVFVKSKLQTKLASQAAVGPVDPCALSVSSPLPETHFRLGGPDPLPLQGVIGGTQCEQLDLTGFSADIAARTYSAGLRFRICDHFGVDETDLYFFGLIPFWILQHERSATLYKPFVNQLDLHVKVSGKF